MKNHFTASLTALILVFVFAVQTVAANVESFPDGPKKEHWSYEGLQYATEQELIKGIDGKIAADQPLTRAQMAAIINRIFEPAEKAEIKNFKDVAESAWYFGDIAKAVSMKTLSGYSAHEMAPNRNITRQEVFSVFARVLKAEGKDKKVLDSFADRDQVASWALPSVAALVEAKIVKGANGRLDPEKNITRAEFATLIKGTFPHIISKEEQLEKEYKGNVVLKGSVRTVKDVVIDGNVILADGLGKEKVTFDNCKILGQVITRGGEFVAKNGTATGTAASSAPLTEGVYFGTANVDQQQYPIINPFIHPPFYNARVRVEVGKDGKITKVSDDNTATKGWDPSKDQASWDKKNKPFWDILLNSGLFEKFSGKTRSEVAAMKMEKGQADVVSGATEAGKAVHQAVLNALDQKEGKKFLTPKETLTSVKKSYSQGTKEILFANTLPKDFKVLLDSVSYGIYNKEQVIKDVHLSEDGTKLIVPENLKPGHYFVNIMDQNKNYRSPDFESGHGVDRHYPLFIIANDGILDFKDGKLTVSKGRLEDIFQNIEEILVTPEGGKPIEIEPIGHHGIKGGYEKGKFFLSDGSVNPNAKTGKTSNPTPVFENGKTYEVELHVWGYEKPLTFTYQARGVEVTKPEEKNSDSIAKAKVDPFGYEVKLSYALDKDGKIAKLEDAETKPEGHSVTVWNQFVAGGGLKSYVGKTKGQLKDVDSFSGATASSKAVREALLSSIK